MPTHYHCLMIYPFQGLRTDDKGYRLFSQVFELCVSLPVSRSGAPCS
jgi:hypothetical protein